MSGRKQHYIPQVLLRAFSPTPKAKAPPIWVYSRNRGLYRTNTKDTAAEREFYSPANTDGESLDDSITIYENQLAQQLGAIRRFGEAEVEGEMAAAVIVHLAIRTDHTRQVFARVGGDIMGAVGQFFGNTSAVKAAMGFNKPLEESLIKIELGKALRQKFPALSEAQMRLVEGRVLAAVSQGFDVFYKKQSPKIAELTDKLEGSVDEMAKSGHVKSLATSIEPKIRIASLAKLHWKLMFGSFVLPDCIAIAIGADQTCVPYILTDADTLHTVFMPIASDLGLYGSVGEDEPPSTDTINEMSSACSADFFIAASEEDKLRFLIDRIATRTFDVVTQMTRKAISESQFALPKSE